MTFENDKKQPFGHPSLGDGSSGNAPGERDPSAETAPSREDSLQDRDFKALVENSSDIITRFDSAYRHVYVNPAVERATGFPPEFWLGKTHRELGFPDGFVSLWEGAIARVFASGESATIDFDYVTPDGIRYFHCQLVPEFDALHVARSVLSIARDLTPLKRTEEALRRSERQLAASQHLAHLGSWEFDFESREVRWSRELYRISGRDPETFQPTESTVIEVAHPDDRARYVEVASECRRTGKPFILDYRALMPDGSIRFMASRGELVRDAEGNAVGMMGYVQDLTLIRTLVAERDLKESELRQAKELERLKNQFVSAVSHELRTPLTSIKGYTEFLLEGVGGEPSDAQRSFVEQIDVSCERLEKLVDDLLDFARLENGSFKLQVAPVDLADRVRRVIQSFYPQTQERRVSLTCTMPEESLKVVTDRMRFEQVLINLIGNALKFTPEGGEVAVSVRREDQAVSFAVTDTGIGISPEDLPRLFTRFTQLDAGNTRKVGGVGLGLSICKVLVEAMGGTIGARSEGVNQGATFWFTIPLQPPAEPPE